MMPEPRVWSVGGTGTASRDCTPVDEGGVFCATTWVTVMFMPVFPLRRARYRLIARQRRFLVHRVLVLQHLGPLDLGLTGVARTALLAWIGLSVVLTLPTGLLGLPGVLMGRFDLAAAGAVLSSLWLIPVGVGVMRWTQGLPWPRRGSGWSRAGFVAELRRTGKLMATAFGGACLLVGGGYGVLAFIVRRVQGLRPQQALLSGLQSAGLIVALCLVVGPALWIGNAARASRSSSKPPT